MCGNDMMIHVVHLGEIVFMEIRFKHIHDIS